MNNLFYTTFEAYIADYPKAEYNRNWLTHDGTRQPLMLKATNDEFYCLFAGGYYSAFVGHWLPKDGGGWWVLVHDSDDFMYRKECGSEAEANQQLEELKDMVPFNLNELELFGFYIE